MSTWLRHKCRYRCGQSSATLISAGSRRSMTIRMLRLCTPSFSSVSSGDPETEVHASTRRRVDVEFMKAGLRGLTLAFSSGDSGPWDEDFQPDGGLFTANYPTSCPYVTAVGGTEFDRCGEVGHEVGVQCTSSCYDDPKTNDTRGYSGGGFSTFYARHSIRRTCGVRGWPRQRMKACCHGAVPPASFWNSSGRGCESPVSHRTPSLANF
jgi:hypothetical protein